MNLLLPVLLPIIAGVLILWIKTFQKNKKSLHGAVTVTLAAELLLVWSMFPEGGNLKLLQLTDQIAISFAVDDISRLFAGLTSVIWMLAGVYALSYMEHEHEQHRFFGFYLIVEGVLIGLDFSADLITLYIFYEMMTLTSLPLVLHERTREAVMAGLKYLFYSVAGAFLALFGIFFLASINLNLAFVPGGSLSSVARTVLDGKEGVFLAAVCCMLIGFGTKAGMFPLHGWLPTAHPVAPAPASAVLSGIITKSGVLAVIRVIFFVVGADMIRGTWVQTVWIVLSLMTVFMGSMLAYKEPVFKKRLAYSTVSQVSYMLFGLSVLEPAAFTGALSHIVFHSVIKNALFFVAGAIIVQTGWTRVEQMRGLGTVMPKTLAAYTLASLALVGIPPASGFVSKWYLATGSLASETGIWSFAGPVVLLISALLTAGYLLPVMINGFFTGHDFDDAELKKRKLIGKEPSACMLIPIVILGIVSLLLGCFPSSLITMIEQVAGSVL
ncbi:MAG: complex I subunit 5 family protein [Brotaphodocola sp.]